MNQNNYAALQESNFKTLLPSPFNRFQTSAKSTNIPSRDLLRAKRRNLEHSSEKAEALDEWVQIMPEFIKDHDAEPKCHTSKLGSPFELVEKTSVRLRRSRRQRRGAKIIQNTRLGRLSK
ncbi:hypothetical protein BOTCAL_0936g00040 [Botryotinia calthae]|uniref:Uncharacterized protein n=1 Tax=Botryotinia calthae TaxID=38488 RepID=A0A4Y8CHF0_9HELO|nr:hypothetical protein BOTCAL_0936g00040 [Botryotinia calthae]